MHRHDIERLLLTPGGPKQLARTLRELTAGEDVDETDGLPARSVVQAPQLVRMDDIPTLNDDDFLAAFDVEFDGLDLMRVSEELDPRALVERLCARCREEPGSGDGQLLEDSINQLLRHGDANTEIEAVFEDVLETLEHADQLVRGGA